VEQALRSPPHNSHRDTPPCTCLHPRPSHLSHFLILLSHRSVDIAQGCSLLLFALDFALNALRHSFHGVSALLVLVVATHLFAEALHSLLLTSGIVLQLDHSAGEFLPILLLFLTLCIPAELRLGCLNLLLLLPLVLLSLEKVLDILGPGIHVARGSLKHVPLFFVMQTLTHLLLGFLCPGFCTALRSTLGRVPLLLFELADRAQITSLIPPINAAITGLVPLHTVRLSSHSRVHTLGIASHIGLHTTRSITGHLSLATTLSIYILIDLRRL
jgi:hypothetical protein